MPRFNAFSRNASKTNLNFFPAHEGIYKLEKIEQAFRREIRLKEFKKCERTSHLGLSRKTMVVNNTVHHSVFCNLGVEIIFKKREHQKKGALK